MADSMRSSCAAPVFKRPRLDMDSNITDSATEFDPIASCEAFYHVSTLKEVAEEVTSSSDPPADINSGDSGFHDFTPPGNNCIDSTPIDCQQQNLVCEPYPIQNSGYIPETDSSELFSHGPSCNGHQTQGDKEVDDNDADDVASTISDLSGLSDLSNQSGQDWKFTAGPFSWVQKQMQLGVNPRILLMELLPKGTFIPPNFDDVYLWRIIMNMLREPPRRTRLPEVNTLDDVVDLLRQCKRIIVLTGAGVSVSCGIPDFRSRNGIYARLSKDYPDLPDPQTMFDIHYFRRDPRPFFKFAKEIYPGQFEPSPSHRFIQLIEQQGKLLRNYTQNIDTLEQTAGIHRVITCHGSFATATCTVCSYKVDSSMIKEDIFSQRIPHCPFCPEEEERGIMKPDIVFFGEGLSDEFHVTMTSDKVDCDLLIVMGSSLKVRPVALIPSSIPPEVPQILINREPLKHLTFDVELLGDCDVIIGEICRRLRKDWNIKEIDSPSLEELTDLPASPPRQFNSNLAVSSSSCQCKNEHFEVNNNSHTLITNCNSTPLKSHSWDNVQVSIGEESNSCDCRGLSEIKLDDSQDETFSRISNHNHDSTCDAYEAPSIGGECIWLPRAKSSLSSRLPGNTYLYIAPNRYIFQGAEVYSDGESDSTSYTGHDNSSSDCDSCTSSDDEDENVETAFNDETSQSHMDFEEHVLKRSDINDPRTSIDSESHSSISSEHVKEDSSS